MTSNIDEIEKKALDLSTCDRAVFVCQFLDSIEEGEEKDAEEFWSKESRITYNLYK